MHYDAPKYLKVSHGRSNFPNFDLAFLYTKSALFFLYMSWAYLSLEHLLRIDTHCYVIIESIEVNFSEADRD